MIQPTVPDHLLVRGYDFFRRWAAWTKLYQIWKGQSSTFPMISDDIVLLHFKTRGLSVKIRRGRAKCLSQLYQFSVGPNLGYTFDRTPLDCFLKIRSLGVKRKKDSSKIGDSRDRPATELCITRYNHRDPVSKDVGVGRCEGRLPLELERLAVDRSPDLDESLFRGADP